MSRLLMGITTIYVIAGGMYSVVITDLIQYVLLTVSGVCVAWVAMSRTTAEQIAASVPAGWAVAIRLETESGLDRTAGGGQCQDCRRRSGDCLRSLSLLVLFKGIAASMAGPAPNYDMQRVLATRNPREAGLMSTVYVHSTVCTAVFNGGIHRGAGAGVLPAGGSTVWETRWILSR